MSFGCEVCGRSFDSKKALAQHVRDSPTHSSSFECGSCSRTFVSEEALAQHLRDSPVHAPSFNCGICSRSFGNEGALAQHVRDSPMHAPSFDCETCDRSFDSEEALAQHLRDSPAHPPSFDCDTCNRSFGNREALEQHLRDSQRHKQAAETPLDIFFSSFPQFDYNPSLPPSTSYAFLQEQKGWRPGDVASRDAWNRYQDALESELHMWYGAEDDLTAWHALCRAIGIDPLPQTCKHCENAVRSTHVNIVDLIEWGRKRGDTEDKVRTFRTVGELRAYTKKTAKIFRNTLNQEEGNIVLRHLLRNIFREGL